MATETYQDRARELVYPLRVQQDRVYRLMLRTTKGSDAGINAAQAVDWLYRAQKAARALYPFDPTGL